MTAAAEDHLAAREWWERVSARRTLWWRRRPELAKRIGLVANLVTWAALAVLLVAVVTWPTMRWSVRVWVGVMWVALCWGLIAHTKTLALRTLFRILALSVPWSFAIALLSGWLARGPGGLREANAVAGAVVVASIVEEILKLGPLALLALAAPGRVRRFTVADWALVGFMSGLAFQLLEEALRRVLLFGPGRKSITDVLCSFGDAEQRLDCYEIPSFGLNPFGTGFGGNPPYAGHAVYTGLIAVGIGLAVRVIRGRLVGVFGALIAGLVPVALFLLSVLDHAARNGSLNETFDQIEDVVPRAVVWLHTATGGGHGREALLVALLVIGMVLDASLFRLANLADVLEDRPVGFLERRYLAVRRATAELGSARVGWFLGSGVDVIFILARDLRDSVLLLFSPAPGPSWRSRAARRVRDVRGLWEQQRRQREEVVRWAFDTPPHGRRLFRAVAALLTLVALALVFVATPLLTAALDIELNGPRPSPWLAGVLEALGEWWNDLPPGLKVAGVVVLGAAVIASGGTLAFALGVGGAVWTALDRADDLGRFVDDPRGTMDEYLAQNSPSDVAVDAGLLVLSFMGEGAVAAAGGRAARAGLDAAEDAGLTRSLRDHIGELPRAIVSIDPALGSRVYSGGGLPLRSQLPEWLRRVREGSKFHRAEQASLNQIPGGSSETYVRKVKPGTGDEIEYFDTRYNRVDHYNDYERQIRSIKHTQLAEVQESTALRYLDELATKYKPGTPIADVPSTPERLLGKSLKGQMILHVPIQESPIPDAVLNRAADLNIKIIDITGRLYT
ncbi:protease prsW family protein [Knoellia remsis]|uniref:Protease prsW family protein n=2 Tax=Knoellia remsis TaxID=407159 RepID=A0A2T0UDT4_9MICO|nr:protease prsW family protein [Knoellia remsis]